MSRVKESACLLTPAGNGGPLCLKGGRAKNRRFSSAAVTALAVTHAPIKVPHGRYKVLKVPREAHTAVPTLL